MALKRISATPSFSACALHASPAAVISPAVRGSKGCRPSTGRTATRAACGLLSRLKTWWARDGLAVEIDVIFEGYFTEDD